MRHTAAGFGLVEIILLVAVSILIGAAGWAVTSHHSKIFSGSTKTYTDPARVYQVSYPARWSVEQRAVDNSGKPPYNVDNNEPHFSPNDGVHTPCNTVSSGACPVNTIDLSALKVSNANDVLKEGWYPVKKETINGYQAYFTQKKYDKTVWDNYFVFHNGVLLDFSFFVVHADGFGDITNDTQHTDAYMNLVHTVKFLN